MPTTIRSRAFRAALFLLTLSSASLVLEAGRRWF